MSRCRTCGEEIVWMDTRNNKKIPVNAHTIGEDKDVEFFNPTYMISHFATCKDAKTWRKK